jgi:hypothetical protein
MNDRLPLKDLIKEVVKRFKGFERRSTGICTGKYPETIWSGHNYKAAWIETGALAGCPK